MILSSLSVVFASLNTVMLEVKGSYTYNYGNEHTLYNFVVHDHYVANYN